MDRNKVENSFWLLAKESHAFVQDVDLKHDSFNNLKLFPFFFFSAEGKGTYVRVNKNDKKNKRSGRYCLTQKWRRFRRKTLTLGDFLRRDNIVFEFFPQEKEKLPSKRRKGGGKSTQDGCLTLKGGGGGGKKKPDDASPPKKEMNLVGLIFFISF